LRGQALASQRTLDAGLNASAEQLQTGTIVHHHLAAQQVLRLDAAVPSWIMFRRLSRQYCSTAKSRV